MKKRTGEPWRPADAYGRSLRGLGVNLLVRDVPEQVQFVSDVLGLEVVYTDPDFAVVRHAGTEWMLHADHTYDTHPLGPRTLGAEPRGAGAELRVYGIDPDAAEDRARGAGWTVVSPSTDRGHGLRECMIEGPDGYVWVPGR